MSETKLVDAGKNKELLDFLHELVNNLIGSDREEVSKVLLSEFKDDSILPCVVVDFQDMNIKISPLAYLDWLASSNDDNVAATLSEFNLITLKLNNFSAEKLISAVVLVFMNFDELRKFKDGAELLDRMDEDWQESSAMFMSFFNHQTKEFFLLNP